MIRYLIAATLLLLPLTAAADEAKDTPDWFHVGTTKSKTEMYARKADLLAGRDYQTDARVWIKFDNARDATVEQTMMMALYSVNCPRQTTQLISMTIYYRNGRNISSDEPGEVGYIVPNTYMDTIAKILCYTPTADDGVVPGGEL